MALFALAGCTSPSVTQPMDKVEVAEATIKPAPLMTWGDLTSRPKPDSSDAVTYGNSASEIVDIWIPDGKGPHPVVIMVHGGCWQKSIADRSLMDYAAEALRREGIAVWNIEYRGVDEAGGGYPGTYLDVARAADLLAENALYYELDMSRIAGFGHSAGGHLVTWLAGRKNLPPGSALYTQPKIEVIGVVNSGGLADLEASEPLTLPSCLAAIKDQLTGAPTDGRPDVMAETSSDRLLPTGLVIHSVNGARDRIAPPELGEGFTAKARAAGDKAQTHIIADEGHVELIAPGTAAFDKQIEILKEMLGVDGK